MSFLFFLWSNRLKTPLVAFTSILNHIIILSCFESLKILRSIHDIHSSSSLLLHVPSFFSAILITDSVSTNGNGTSCLFYQISVNMTFSWPFRVIIKSPHHSNSASVTFSFTEFIINLENARNLLIYKLVIINVVA